MAKRKSSSLRKVSITRGFTKYAEGAVLIEQGNTKVLCTASVENSVPPFLRGQGKGWVTAEYGMLPRSTHSRNRRDSKRSSPNSRSIEISRLIGRSLRAAINLEMLGENSITIDCDVLQADGGTRCASITGGMVALADAVEYMLKKGLIGENPIKHFIAAISVGMIDGTPTLDLDYALDSTAEVDMNVVMTDDGRYVEIQGTAENEPFSDKQLTAMRKLASDGIAKLIQNQRKALRVKR
jgi:ribonuclease PH